MIRRVRNVEISGHRTSFRLEQPFWDAADSIVRDKRTTMGQLFTEIQLKHRGPKATMTSAIRVFIVEKMREDALRKERNQGIAR